MMSHIYKIYLLCLIIIFSSQAQEIQIDHLETCFSPKEQCDQKLINLINSSKKNIDIAIYSIAHPDIAKAIIDAKNRNISVRMVVDRLQSAGQKSETDNLTKEDVPLKIGNVQGYMHNKFIIVDNEILETGSYNYSKNATTNNAENQIYIKDLNTIKKFQDNFEILWLEGLPIKKTIK